MKINSLKDFRTFIIIRCVCLMAFLVATVDVAAKGSYQYYFESLDMQDGLSQNSVSCILQDSHGFMWFATRNGLNRYDSQEFRVFNTENSSLGNNFITYLFEAADGELWVGTDAGVYIYSPRQDAFTFFDVVADSGERLEHTVTRIREDGVGNIWISVDFQGFFRYEPATGRLVRCMATGIEEGQLANVSDFWFENDTCWVGLYGDNLYYTTDGAGSLLPFKDKSGREVFRGENIQATLASKDGSRFIGSSKGLRLVNGPGGEARMLLEGYVRALCYYSDDELWVGTEDGIYIYRLSTGSFIHLTAPLVPAPYVLSDSAIYAIYRDAENGMWIGSYFGGVNYYPYPYARFEKYIPNAVQLFGKRIREFCGAADGTLWFGTEDLGLYNFNPRTKEIRPCRFLDQSANVHGLCADGDYLWVGVYSGGLHRIHLPSGRVKVYRKGDSPRSLDSNDVVSLYKDSRGVLWIGTAHGVLRYNRDTDDFTRISHLNNINVLCFHEDQEGLLWVSTFANGVFCHDPRTETWKQYTYQEGVEGSLPCDKVTSIHEDACGRLWFTTQGGGICRYDRQKDGFVVYDVEQGMPSNDAFRMEEDRAGNLWVSTGKGLLCFNPDTGYRKVYTESDGLIDNSLNYQSGYRDADGNLYFGTLNGFILFNPATFSESSYVPPIVFTALQMFDKEVPVGSPGSSLTENILFARRLTLPSDMGFFSLHVAALSYHSSSRYHLQYQLEGLSDEWYGIDNRSNAITFAHLPFGDYKLRVRFADKTVSETAERVLDIRILPPFYLSSWAFVVYAFLFLLSLTCLVLYLRKRYRERQLLLIRETEQRKEKELYDMKIDFFTNVTHEIRTPLTLIRGPLERVLQDKDQLPGRVRDNLQMMALNVDRLLSLVNQLLDFRKVEQPGFVLNLSPCAVTELLKGMVQRFSALADYRNLQFTLHADEDIHTLTDSEALQKIFSNLLNNALKYSEHFVNVRLWQEQDVFRLSVCNDGQIIPPEVREEIFKPFVQYRKGIRRYISGTGIGLPLACALAAQLGGRIYMDEDKTVNCFILEIPIRSVPASSTEVPVKGEEGLEQLLPRQVGAVPSEEGKPVKTDYTLLLVEDNEDMMAFIAGLLRPLYRLLTASNGEEALEHLKAHPVHLIVSDIMMPVMDGMELCRRVKDGAEYCHIPFILLTAKSTLQSKIEGIRYGADAYIEKPFSVDLLLSTISSLLKTREQLRKIFSASPFLPVSSIGVTETDKHFLQKLAAVTEENMGDVDFNIDALASDMHMSRSSLNRKLRGVLDMTPNDYIRQERLRKAYRLLKEGHGSNEVCFVVGFNTPSYFARCFRQQFGISPKDLQKSGPEGD